ncbi:hypothetical protein ACFX1T_003047 [Malus domestica]
MELAEAVARRQAGRSSCSQAGRQKHMQAGSQVTRSQRQMRRCKEAAQKQSLKVQTHSVQTQNRKTKCISIT